MRSLVNACKVLHSIEKNSSNLNTLVKYQAVSVSQACATFLLLLEYVTASCALSDSDMTFPWLQVQAGIWEAGKEAALMLDGTWHT